MASHLRRSGSEGLGTLFERTPGAFPGADAYPEAVCGSRARGAGRGARRGPRLQRDVLPLRGKLRGRPVSPGSRRLGASRTGHRNTERKGNQPALTCKQGFHLEEPAQTEHRNIHLHSDPPVTNPLARPGAHQAGTRAVGGCSFRPHSLQPRMRGSQPQTGTQRQARAPCLLVGVMDPRNQIPGSDPRPGFPLARSPVAPRRKGAGLHFGERGAGEIVLGGVGGGVPLQVRLATRAREKIERGSNREWPRLPGPWRPPPSLPAAPPPCLAQPLRAHRPVSYLNSPVHLAKSAAEPPNIPHIDPVTA